jgi:hypothetical protein
VSSRLFFSCYSTIFQLHFFQPFPFVLFFNFFISHIIFNSSTTIEKSTYLDVSIYSNHWWNWTKGQEDLKSPTTTVPPLWGGWQLLSLPNKTLVGKTFFSISKSSSHSPPSVTYEFRFKLFFVPLFPVNRSRPFLQCQMCHCVFDSKVVRQLPKSHYTIESLHMYERCPHCSLALPVATEINFCPYCAENLGISSPPPLIPAHTQLKQVPSVHLMKKHPSV